MWIIHFSSLGTVNILKRLKKISDASWTEEKMFCLFKKYLFHVSNNHWCNVRMWLRTNVSVTILLLSTVQIVESFILSMDNKQERIYGI